MSRSVFMSIKVCGQYLIKSTIKSFGTIIFCCNVFFVVLYKQKNKWVTGSISLYLTVAISKMYFVNYHILKNKQHGKKWTRKYFCGAILCQSLLATWLSQVMFCKLKFISCDVKPSLFLIAGIESLSEWNGWSGLVELVTGFFSTKRACSLHETLV